ncbi:MAG: DUF362 domain-containing protein [Spirochaetales bacterium]|nr:DUF362 domain-containing protein [Spirochaetales bacterium]
MDNSYRNMKESSNVYIDRCSSYAESELNTVLNSVLSSIEKDLSSDFSFKNKKVLIKPNILSDAPPQKAVTTHPLVIKGLIREVQDRGGIAYVGDSPAIHTSHFNASVCGIQDVCRETGAAWLNFTEGTEKYPLSSEDTEADGQKGAVLTSHISEMDIIISAAKMKTHQLMGMTGAVKNLFGLMPGLQKSPYHLKYPTKKQFGNFLLDIFSSLPRTIAVMDAVTAMEGPGPNNGYPKGVGIILGSADPTALDAAASDIMGYSPMEISTIPAAVRRNLTKIKQYEDISFPHLSPNEVRPKDFLLIPNKGRAKSSIVIDFFLSKLAGPLYRKRKHGPVIKPESCISCGKCAAICPGSAIMKGKNSFFIDLGRCIRCYCCHEVCPADAISIVKQNADKEQKRLLKEAEK